MPILTEKYKFIHRLQGLVNGLGSEIAEHLEGALEHIAGKIIILESKVDLTKSLVRKKKLLDQQRSEIERVLNEVYQDIGKTIESKAIETAQATPRIINSMIIKSLPAKLQIQTGVPKLDKKRIASWFESSQIEGLYFNDWLKKLESNSVARIIRETRQSMLLSEPRRQTAKRIQAALDVGRRSAEGLAHNSIHQAHIWAEREYYLQNKNHFRSLRFTAELDRLTSAICRSLDGQEFPLKEAPQPPLHWKCRSFLVPIFRNERIEDFLARERKNTRIARIDEKPRTIRHRDGTTSTSYEKLRVQFVPEKMTHNQWVQSLVNSDNLKDVGFAREMLGKTRFDLVKSGKLKVESLFYAGKLRNIKQLKELMR